MWKVKSNFDKIQKLQLQKNEKLKMRVEKVNISICDKTQKKILTKLKTQIVKNFKTLNCDRGGGALKRDF